jgi:hypothetical protein
MLSNILIELRPTQIEVDRFIATCMNKGSCVILVGESTPDLGLHGVLEFPITG